MILAWVGILILVGLKKEEHVFESLISVSFSVTGQCLVWVQCSFPNCEKWRRLHGNIDPSVLPDNWSCDQNTGRMEWKCFLFFYCSSLSLPVYVL